MPQGAKLGAKRKPSVRTPDPYKRELADRIGKAFKTYNANVTRDAELFQKDLGRLVAKRLGQKEPFTQPAVSAWMNPDDPSQPDNPTLEAIAYVLKVDKTWLVFGGAKD